MANETIQVKMAGMAVVKNSAGERVRLKTILGSCVGLIFFDEKRDMSGLAHIMLPEKLGDDRTIGKYADTAIPTLIGEMEKKGSTKKDIKAYLIGGACMFGSCEKSNIGNIGRKNSESVERILKDFNIPIVFEDIGKNYGRVVIFDCKKGRIRIESLKRFNTKGVKIEKVFAVS